MVASEPLPSFYPECDSLTSNIYVHRIERNEIGGACRAFGGEERRTQGFVGKPEGMTPLGRPRHRWEDNIRLDLQEVGCGLDRTGSG